MNLHKPILERGLLRVTPYDLLAFGWTLLSVGALCVLIIMFG